MFLLKFLLVLSTRTLLWTDLKNRFSQKNGPRLFQLQKQLATITQGELSITDHFTWLNVLWDEIENYRALPCCTCGSCKCSINEKLTQYQLQDSVMQFLMGLNETYSQIQGQILLLDPLPLINKVYSLLIQDESQRSIAHLAGDYVESTALAAQLVVGLANLAYGGGPAGKGSKNKGKDRPVCSHCGITGHTMEKCYKLHGYPPGYRAKGKNPKADQVVGLEFGSAFGGVESDLMPVQ